MVHKIKEWFSSLKQKILIKYDLYILSKITARRNHKLWKDVIDIDYEYHPSYLILIIRHKLSLIHDVWGKYTDHEKDYDEKEKLEELIDIADHLIDKGINGKFDDEYKKLSKSFFTKLDRLHIKLID